MYPSTVFGSVPYANGLIVLFLLTLPGTVLVYGQSSGEQAQSPVHQLDVIKKGAPKAFFFRSSEFYAGNWSEDYERWERAFEPLNGIMGKVLNEERPGLMDTNVPFFTRFKRNHPRQMVMVHFDPKARRPQYDRDRFFAGHWLYFNGSTMTEPIPAESGTTTIHVRNPNLFRVYGEGEDQKTDEIGICRMGSDGEPDWTRAEQVKLVKVDRNAGTITVKRGQFGTEPRAFPAGSYLAAHYVDRFGSHPIQWVYNLAAGSPEDEAGHSCADVLINELVSKLGPDGSLSHFDGVQFDIMMFDDWGPPANPQPGDRGQDVNADGEADWATVDGLDRWGTGNVRFARRLRQALGPKRLMLADGWTAGHQRNFGILNGIESEGWPSLKDYEIVKWSGGLNRHRFWAVNGAEPQLSYINHKFHGIEGSVGDNIDRLVMAGAALTGSAFAGEPDEDPNHPIEIFDELVNGKTGQANWLGQPSGPAHHLATRKRDLLNGRGQRWPQAFVGELEGPSTTFERRDRGEVLQVSSTMEDQDTAFRPDLTSDPWRPTPGNSATREDRKTFFYLPKMKLSGKDMVVQIRLKAEPLAYYPDDVASTISRCVLATWKTNRETGPFSPERLMTWADGDWFTSTFYFRNIGPGSGRLGFYIEGDAPFYIDRLTVHAGADAMYRKFENGIVLANPSTRPYTFTLTKLAPAASYRRIDGQVFPEVNSGEVVGETVTVGSRDALFLVAED